MAGRGWGAGGGGWRSVWGGEMWDKLVEDWVGGVGVFLRGRGGDRGGGGGCF